MVGSILRMMGIHPPKLLKYNANTPTALVEAAVAQWFRLSYIDERSDQFNSIHEQLIAAWERIRAFHPGPLHYAAMAGIVEDYITIEYLRVTAIQAGFETRYVSIEQIGWDAQRRLFVDEREEPIRMFFKRYAWKGILHESFGPHFPVVRMRYLEPPWKMILSCKSILPLLYERHPESPYLLPASFEPLDGPQVCLPVHSREGANITVKQGEREVLTTTGPYSDGPWIYQQLAPMNAHDGRYPICGRWIEDVRCRKES